MKERTTTAAITLHSGVVKLDEDLARPRMHCLTPVKGKNGKPVKDTFEINQPIQFKAGQMLTFDAPKGLESSLEPIEPPKKTPAELRAELEAAEAEEKAKADADAKAKAEADAKANA